MIAMKRTISVLAAAACVTMPLWLLGTAAHAESLATYDNFKGKALDVDKWFPSGVGFGALDFRRQVERGRAKMEIRSYGATSTNEGRVESGHGLEFPETVAAGINRVKIKAQIHEASQRVCAANTGQGRLLVPRIQGFWFNDGTCTTDSCGADLSGDMFASISVRQNVVGDHLPDGAEKFRIVSQLFRCSDPDCFDGEEILFDDTSLGSVKLKKGKRANVTLELQWNEDGDEFIYKANGKTLTQGYDPDLNQRTPGGGFVKVINVQARVLNCDLTGDNPPKRPQARVDVGIKKVEINKSAIP